MAELSTTELGGLIQAFGELANEFDVMLAANKLGL